MTEENDAMNMLNQHVETAKVRMNQIRDERLELDELISINPLKKIVCEFDETDPYLGYGYVPRYVKSLFRELNESGKNEQIRSLLELMLLFCIGEFNQRFAASRLPPIFLPEYEKNIRRILELSTAKSESLDTLSDSYLKDFGIVRFSLIPCVSHLVYRYSGVPRSLLLKGGDILGKLKLLKLLLTETGGFRPYLENHVHPAMLDDFSATGRERCYRLIAELFRRWPDVRGLIGSSWYYDSKVALISPHLGYLHKIPFDHGACFVDLGVSEEAKKDATERSSKRMEMVRKGDYHPKNYFMVWSREKILNYVGSSDSNGD